MSEPERARDRRRAPAHERRGTARWSSASTAARAARSPAPGAPRSSGSSRELAPRFPGLGFAEVRYRIKSWRRLELCVEDARAAIAAAGGGRTLLLGFSMGGAVAISAADDPRVVGRARARALDPRAARPRAARRQAARRPPRLARPLAPRRPRRLEPRSPARGFERARALGVEGSYTLVRGGVHGLALRAPGGRPAAAARREPGRGSSPLSSRGSPAEAACARSARRRARWTFQTRPQPLERRGSPTRRGRSGSGAARGGPRRGRRGGCCASPRRRRAAAISQLLRDSSRTR